MVLGWYDILGGKTLVVAKLDRLILQSPNECIIWGIDKKEKYHKK
jgi:hypothetical protein